MPEVDLYGQEHEPEPLRFVVADGDALSRKVLTAALNDEIHAVVAEATSGHEAVELTRFYHPDVVLIGDRLIGTDTLEAAHGRRGRSPRPGSWCSPPCPTTTRR